MERPHWNTDDFAPTTVRIMDGLVDVGTRHRGIGKTHAIVEEAIFEAQRDEADVYIVTHSERGIRYIRQHFPVVKDMARLKLVVPDDFNREVRTREALRLSGKATPPIVALADEAPSYSLYPGWSSPVVIRKAGWWIPEMESPPAPTNRQAASV
jgi:hypothetical protein